MVYLLKGGIQMKKCCGNCIHMSWNNKKMYSECNLPKNVAERVGESYIRATSLGLVHFDDVCGGFEPDIDKIPVDRLYMV